MPSTTPVWAEPSGAGPRNSPPAEAIPRVVALAVLGALTLVVATYVATTASYREPSGHFSVIVPEGWAVQTIGDGEGVRAVSPQSPLAFVRIVRAAGSAKVPQRTNSLGSVVPGITRIRQTAAGTTRVAGEPAVYAEYAAVSNDGVDSALRVVTLTSGSDGYVIVMGAPANLAGDVRAPFRTVERSFRIGEARPYSDALMLILAVAFGGAAYAVIRSVPHAELRADPLGRSPSADTFAVERGVTRRSAD